VKAIEAVVYDALKWNKKIKRKDFKDQSASGGGTLFWLRYPTIDYTPTQYHLQ
jgi:hypothetical protein